MSSAIERPEEASPPVRRNRRSARTRERILLAATEVFARRGFHGTRVADIADGAGIAYGLVYHHFKNKDEILVAIYSEKWGKMVAYLGELGRQPLSFREKMAKLVHFWVRSYRQDPHLMTLMINEITRSYEFLESHGIAAVIVAFDGIQAIIEDGLRRGEVRPDVDAKLATYLVIGAAEMVLTGYVMGTLRRGTEAEWTHDEQQIVELLLRGIVSDQP